MSFQTYLYSIEEKTGMTPRQLLQVARDKGYYSPTTTASEIRGWLKQDYGLGQGHGLMITHLIQKDSLQAGTAVDRRHELEGLWLDGKATAPGSN